MQNDMQTSARAIGPLLHRDGATRAFEFVSTGTQRPEERRLGNGGPILESLTISVSFLRHLLFALE